MDFKIMIVLLLICSLLTLYPIIYNLKHSNSKFIQYAFISNMVIFMSIAVLVSTFFYSQTHYVLVILIIATCVCFGYRSVYAAKKESMKKNVLTIFMIASLALSILVLIMNFGNRYLMIGTEPSDITESMMLLTIFTIINGLIVSKAMDKTNYIKYQYFMLTILAILVVSFVILQAIPSIVAKISSGNLTVIDLVTGQIAGEGMDVFSQIWFTILNDPTLLIVIAIMTFGGIFKTLDIAASDILGNVLVSWIPILIWVMVFVGYIEVPQAMYDLFSGMAWFGWFMYVIITMIIFITIISAIRLFTELSSRIVGG